MSNVKEGNWFKRHKVLSIVGGSILVLSILVTVTDPSTKTSIDAVNSSVKTQVAADRAASIKKTATKSAPQPTNTTKVTTPAPAPKPATPTTKQQVADWFTRYSYSLNLYAPDFDKIDADAGNNDIAAVGSDCEELSSDVTTAQDLPAIPDAQSASDFSSALTYYQTGAQECVTAAENNDTAGITSAAALFTKGNSAIALTTADIKAVK